MSIRENLLVFVQKLKYCKKRLKSIIKKLSSPLTVLCNMLYKLQIVFQIEGWRVPKQISVAIFLL